LIAQFFENMEHVSSFIQSPETLITNEIIKLVSAFVCDKNQKSIWKSIICTLKNVCSTSWKIGILLLVTYLVKNPSVLLDFLGKVSKYLFYKKLYLSTNIPIEQSQGVALELETKLYVQNNNIKGDPYFLVNSVPLYCLKHSSNEYKIEYLPIIHSTYLARLNETIKKAESTVEQIFFYKLLNGKNVEITNLFPSRNNRRICDIVSTFFEVSKATRCFFTLGILINGIEGIGKTESLSYIISQGACDKGILINMNKNLDISFDEILKKIFSFPSGGRNVIYIDELDKYLDYYLKNEYRKASIPPAKVKKEESKTEESFEPPPKEDFMQSKKEEFLMKLLGLIETRYFKDGVVFVFCANNFNTIFEGVDMKHFRSVYKRIHKIHFQECDAEEFKEYCRWYNKILSPIPRLNISQENLEKCLENVREDLCIPLREVFFANVESSFQIEKFVHIVNKWVEEDLTKIDTSSPSKNSRRCFDYADEKLCADSPKSPENMPCTPPKSFRDSSPPKSKEYSSESFLDSSKDADEITLDTLIKIIIEKSADDLTQFLNKGGDQLINAKNNDGRTPLHTAAMYNSKDCLQLLLDYGAEINAKGKNGLTPLHNTALYNSKDCLQLLLEAGAEINAKDKYGWTPLHTAVTYGAVDCLKMLIQLGADLNEKDNKGNTPLHFAPTKRCWDLLVDAGADTTIQNDEGRLPEEIK
jgi:hypothetical protein